MRAHTNTHTGGCTTTNSSERVKGVEFFVRLHSNAERLVLSKPAEEKKIDEGFIRRSFEG